jgi:hypothetical protein
MKYVWGDYTFQKDTRHNIQLVLRTHISIISIEVAFSMIQAIIQNATLLYTCLLLLNSVEFLNFNMPHKRFRGYQNPSSCSTSQLHLHSRSSKPGDRLTKGFSFATTLKEFHVIGPYFTDVLRSFTVRQEEMANFEVLNLSPDLGWDVRGFRWKDMSTSIRA